MLLHAGIQYHSSIYACKNVTRGCRSDRHKAQRRRACSNVFAQMNCMSCERRQSGRESRSGAGLIVIHCTPHVYRRVFGTALTPSELACVHVLATASVVSQPKRHAIRNVGLAVVSKAKDPGQVQHELDDQIRVVELWPVRRRPAAAAVSDG